MGKFDFLRRGAVQEGNVFMLQFGLARGQELALAYGGVNCPESLVQPVLFFKLPRQIFLRQVLKILIG